MKNKTRKRKTTNKKHKENQLKRKKILLAILVIVFAVMFTGLICYILKSKNLVCSKNNSYDKGITQLNEMVFNYKGGKLNSIRVNKKITIDDDNDVDKLGYLKIIDESLKSSYKNKGINYVSKISEDTLVVNLLFNEKKEYILDDVDIILEGTTVSVNVVTEDNNNNRISVDLNNNNHKNSIKNLLKNKEYVCN